MRRMIKGLTNAAFFLLCYAPVPLLTSHFLLGNCLYGLLLMIPLLPLSFLLSLLPGRVGGGKKRNQVMVERASRGNDPDPDRSLRNEALPLPEKRAFPLRAVVSLFALAGVMAGIFIVLDRLLPEVRSLNRAAMSAVIAVMLPLALRVVALNSENVLSTTAGMILYIISGIVVFVTKDQTLDQWLLPCGLAFIVMLAFSMNNQSMAKGASVREGVRPPVSMRRRNRVMLLGVAVVGCIVLYFDRIRQATISAVQWIGGMLWKIFVFLSNLVYGDDIQESSGGGGSGMDMGGMFGPAESSPFWEAMEYVAYAVVAVALAGIAFWLSRRIWRLIVLFSRRLAAYLKKFTAAVGEEYRDEQESLFDWGETQKELGESLRKRIEQLFKREKRWEQMDVRERMRFVVRALYRRTPDNGRLRSMTVHEALAQVKTGQAQPEELARVYDQARYGQHEPDGQLIERLRKEAKV